jgi:hypothetical protein
VKEAKNSLILKFMNKELETQLKILKHLKEWLEGKQGLYQGTIYLTEEMQKQLDYQVNLLTEEIIKKIKVLEKNPKKKKIKKFWVP